MRQRDLNILREFAKGVPVAAIAKRRRLSRMRVNAILKPHRAKVESLRAA